MSPHHGSQPIPGSKVHIAAGAITIIVEEVVLSCYAFVGMAPRFLGFAIIRRLGIGNQARGIHVSVADDRGSIERSVVLKYGTSIFSVASNVMQTVRFQVQRMLGLKVERININVDGLHVSDPSRSQV